jgi:glycosyltransferase involved in cell wall biosynthesis
MVYNSNDTQKRALEIGPWLSSKESYVIPPFFEDAVVSNPRPDKNWITLVNFSKDKGADIFNLIASTDKTGTRKYVGIKGSHGSQEAPHESVTLLNPTENMEDIWQNTRILVVLSTYETWSMVATEAMMRGIPVVCADKIPALRENCGEAAVYVDRTNPKDCLAAFEHIESNYTTFSNNTIIQARKHLPNLDIYQRLLW